MRVAIRVDAGLAMGAGHFMRCLTLAQGLVAAGAIVRMISQGLPAHLQALGRTAGCEVVALPGPEPAPAPWPEAATAADASATVAALGSRWDWVVVDHYALGAGWEAAVHPLAGRILAIDDLADRDHACDVLVDQNLYRDAELRYRGRVPAGCRLLLGPRYALLRAEFAALHAAARPREGAVTRQLISFGGADSENHTGGALAALEGVLAPGCQVDVVLGASHPRREELLAQCAARGFRAHVQTGRMAELMSQADLAIGAGGISTWERCCVGLPAIVAVIAANQRQLVADGGAAGILQPLAAGGDFTGHLRRELAALLASPERRRAISVAGLAAVDGRGAERVLEAMGVERVQIRRAGRQDSTKLLDWRNHPKVRQSSRTTEVIARETHEAWLEGVLRNADRPLLLGSCAEGDVGVVRFDIAAAEAEVSIYLAPEFHGRGLGGALLGAAERWLRRERPDVRRLRAVVLGDNRASHRLFVAAGYSTQGAEYAKALT
jgi:UDP-2,4-diacetamido-2,4,6-trideoxy-beta-L-altropyranose hydrolase